MKPSEPPILLTGTDLSAASDAVVRTAVALAVQTGARLHVVHVTEGPAAGDRASARAALDEQLRRVLPAGFEVASAELRAGTPAEALEAAAGELDADLLVLGPHGGSALTAHFLGSTADRVLRTSRRPCLVVRSEMSFPVRGVGVAIDFSEPSSAALRQAFHWAPLLSGPDEPGRPPLRILHVDSPLTLADFPDHEQATLRPRIQREIEGARGDAEVPYAVDVKWDYLIPDMICRWAQKHGLGLLVVGTQGLSGLPRAILGSTATRVTRHSPCPVLMVPPGESASRAERAPALDRLLLGIDFSPGSLEAAAWAARLAPDAELLLAHAVQIPHPPAPLRGSFPAHQDLVRSALDRATGRLEQPASELSPRATVRVVREGRPADVLADLAREVGADLVVVGVHGRWGAWSGPGSTADTLAASAPVPVLLAQGFDEGPPTEILVPVDDSANARRALAWAVFLARRFEARLTLFHVLSSGLLAPMRRVSSVSAARELEENARSATRSWLEDQARAADAPEESTSVEVGTGTPGLEIFAAAARLGSDLIVIGSRGSGAARALGLGSVSSAVVRKGTGPVLLVPPARP